MRARLVKLLVGFLAIATLGLLTATGAGAGAGGDTLQINDIETAVEQPTFEFEVTG